jgi:hypothetical protein
MCHHPRPPAAIAAQDHTVPHLELATIPYCNSSTMLLLTLQMKIFFYKSQSTKLGRVRSIFFLRKQL